MAIIRSKIARQLLAEGGAPRKGFMFGSPGSAEQEASFGAQAAMNQDDYESLDQEGQAEVDQARFDAGIRSADFGNLNVNEGSDTPSFFQRGIDALGTGLQNRRGQSIMDFLGRSTAPTMRGRLGLGKPGDINYVLDLLQNPDDRVYGLSNKEREIGEKLISAGIRDEFDIRNMTQSQFDTLFPGPPTGGGGDNEPIKRLRAPITEAKKEEPKNEFDELLKFYGARFEDGGDVRQEYGLGSIVKKIGRTVKKVAKSPLGKAAILGAAAFGLPAIGSFPGTPGFLKSELGKKIFFSGKDAALANLNPFSAITAASLLAGSLAKEEEEDDTLPAAQRSDPAFQSLLAYYGGPRRFAEDGGDIDKAPVKMAGYGYNEAMSDTFDMYNDMKKNGLIPPTMSFDEFLQEVVPEMSKKKGIERAQAAKGGMMEQDEMLDLGGKEMDLRGGGFVPLGEYEKKDDVPARLSKNEFVMTADAVRAAGGGSVDRGADIMYKTMKTLENKVA